MWVVDLKCMLYFQDIKNLFRMNVIFYIKQVKVGYITFVSTQHDPFIKHVKQVGSYPTSLIGRIRVEKS